NPDGIRGYSGVALLIIDEASFFKSDESYNAVRPMLATSQGRIMCLSTPFGKRGFFHHEYTKGDGWQRFTVRASDCPRHPPEFLARERRRVGDRRFDQEFNCVFHEAIGQVFSQADIDAAFGHGGLTLDLGLSQMGDG